MTPVLKHPKEAPRCTSVEKSTSLSGNKVVLRVFFWGVLAESLLVLAVRYPREPCSQFHETLGLILSRVRTGNPS